MKVLGIITEYNPFHNGHLYHIQKSKEESGADHVICVMSGNFIQRGEPAIVNKWARAEMALYSGIDLVLELPVVYAMASAEFFAFGAVKILDSLGITDCLSFGSESGNIAALNQIADIFVNEPPNYKSLLKKQLDKGLSFPSARQSALMDYLTAASHATSDLENVLSWSNNILGIEYLKAIKKLNSKITPLTITRKGNSYNSEELTGSISSATSIRKHISSSSEEDKENSLSMLLPSASYTILQREFEAGRGPVFPGSFEDILLAALRKMSTAEISLLPYVSEGLENRIKEASDRCGSLVELIDSISTRRYPRTRIQRSLFSVLTGLKSADFDTFNNHGGPQYIRVLGFNSKGRSLLSSINKSASLPVIVKAANFKETNNSLVSKMLKTESSATDIYVLGYENSNQRKSGQEFTQNVVRVNI